MTQHDQVRISSRGELTVPKPIRTAYAEAFGVELDQASVLLREDGVIELRPQLRIDPSQAFFWTPEWQQAEAAAQDDIARGRITRHDDGDAFLDSLDDTSS